MTTQSAPPFTLRTKKFEILDAPEHLAGLRAARFLTPYHFDGCPIVGQGVPLAPANGGGYVVAFYVMDPTMQRMVFKEQRFARHVASLDEDLAPHIKSFHNQLEQQADLAKAGGGIPVEEARSWLIERGTPGIK